MQTNIVPSRNLSALPRIRSALMLVLAIALAGFAAAGPPRAQAATTVTVSPITANGWGFGHKVTTGTGSFLAGPATADLEPLMVVYVDDSWAGTPAGSDPDGAGPANVFGGDAFATIQEGIDAVASGGTVRVFPGVYSETAANRTLASIGGTYTFGLFFGAANSGVTLQGVDVNNQPITAYTGVQATVNTNATNNFGPSGIFVEGDDVTIAGIRVGTNSAGQNKTLEVIGDNFTLKQSSIADPQGSVYINDFRFDTGSNTSHVKGYTIDGNLFGGGVTLDIASGAGYSGPASSRIIANNVFDLNSSTRPAISFSGSGGVPWFVYPVGGAQIHDNSFAGAAAQYIRARGTYDNGQFDWAAYWNANTFDKAVVVGPTPPTDVRVYSYTSGAYTFDNVRRIGATIQGEVDNAQADDTVLVKAGLYTEQVTLQKSVKLTGAGAGASSIKAPATIPPASDPDSAIVVVKGAGVDAEISGFTVAGPGPSGCGSIRSGIFVRDTASANIHDNSILNIRDEPFSGCQNGNGILVGRQLWGTSGTAIITNNQIEGYQKGGIVVDNAGSSATITGNTVKGAGAQTQTAQNGVQISRGATGTLSGNTILDHLCNHTSCGPDLLRATQSAGVLLFNQGAGVVVATNTISNNDDGVYNYASPPATITENVLTANRYAAIYLAQGSATVAANEISGASNVGVALVSFNGDTADAAGALTNNTISGAGKGVQLLDEAPSDSAIPTATLQLNSIAGNTVGVDNSTPAQVDATRNWWGSPTGPSGASNPGGTGDSMSGNIGFDPWLCDGTDTSPATGFQPNPDALCGGAAPNTSITSQPANPSSSTTATFAFAGTDDVTPPASLTFECQLDGAGFTACTSAKTYTGLANGSHTFQVRSRDAAGNLDPTPASYTWTIAVAPADTTPPNTTIVTGPPSSSSSATATFTFNGADNMTPPAGLTFECRLDGAAFAPCSSPKTYTGLQSGAHTFQVRARDAAGNVDPTPATHGWTIQLSGQHMLYLPLIQR